MRKNASSKYAHGVTATVAAKCVASPRAESGKRREQAASAKKARTPIPVPAESNARAFPRWRDLHGTSAAEAAFFVPVLQRGRIFAIVHFLKVTA